MTEDQFRIFLSSFRPPSASIDRWPPMIIPEFVCDHGRFLDTRVALPADQVFPTSRRCYWNAWTHRLHDKSLRYCEGYVSLGWAPDPVLHGWLLDSDGRVHDPSVANDDQATYYGVVFRPEVALRFWKKLLKIDAWGIIENAWRILPATEDFFAPLIAAVERQAPT